MQNDTQRTPVAGVVRTFPTVPNRENLTLAELADAYMAAYAGRDPGRVKGFPRPERAMRGQSLFAIFSITGASSRCGR